MLSAGLLVGRLFVKQFALRYRTVVCPVCPICNVDVLWPEVGWIKMKLGMEVGLGPGHIVLDADTASPLQKGHNPQVSAHVYCGWIKMPLGVEVGLGPGHIVLDESPAPPQKRGAQPPPMFGPCLLWPNGWADQDVIWYAGRPRTTKHCVTWGPSSAPPPKKKAGNTPSTFQPMSIVAKQSPISATAELLYKSVLSYFDQGIIPEV